LNTILRNSIFFLLLPALIGTFNVLVNPFDQWNIPRVASINDKITETRWDTLIKSCQIRHGSYDTVILGSSRAAIALSPQHPAFATHSVYNYGLSGAGIYLQFLALQHAVATQPITRIIITPDFFGFNANLALNQPSAHEQADLIDLMSQPGLTHPGILPSTFSNTFANTLGWRGTNSSLRTLIAQNQKTAYIDRQGHWNRFGTKDRNFIAQFDRTEKIFLTELLFPSPNRQYAFEDARTGYNSFEIYRQMLELAYQHHLGTSIVILPTPSRDLLALQKLGQWQNYRLWKTRLVQINESVATGYPTSPFAIWDFEAPDSRIESDHLADLKPYFYEPFHPTSLVGDRILNRIFMDCSQVTCWPGHMLDSGNVASTLSELDQYLTAYALYYPQQITSLDNNIDKTAAYRSETPRTPY
jgi:hypothetical protein